MNIPVIVRACLLLVIGICVFGSIFILNMRIENISTLSRGGHAAGGVVTVGYPGSALCRMTVPVDRRTAGLLKEEDIWAALSACAERERETALDHPPVTAFDI